jgi:hypothetical protein
MKNGLELFEMHSNEQVLPASTGLNHELLKQRASMSRQEAGQGICGLNYESVLHGWCGRTIGPHTRSGNPEEDTRKKERNSGQYRF